MKIKGAFWICSALLIALLAVPHLGTKSAPWLNGIYDSFCTLAAFPFIVWMGASGVCTGCILLAWVVMKFYDTPVRRWLSSKF